MPKTRPIDQSTTAEKRRINAEKILQIGSGNWERTLTELKTSLNRPELKSTGILETMFDLCEKLRPIATDLDVIISDEASGRVPSLIIKSTLDAFREQQGLPPLKIFFLVGGYSTFEQKDSVAEFVRTHAVEFRRSLIVTEIIESGESIREFLKPFSQNGLKPIVASVSVARDPSTYRQLFSNKLIYGEVARGGAGQIFYGLAGRRMAGIVKGSRSVAHPESLKARLNEPTMKAEAQRGIQLARSDIALIGQVYAGLLSGKERPKNV